jgi:hypothetical protein
MGCKIFATKISMQFQRAKMWDDPEEHGAIGFRTLNIRNGLMEERLTAVLIYKISVLSVIYIKLYKS